MVSAWVALGVALFACARASVLASVPEPAREPLAPAPRTLRRLVGGHIKLQPEKHAFGNPSKNTFASNDKSKLDSVWDDGMLMSSAGEGKDKVKEEDEDKKTLSDQVAEGKYGLIQNEIFQKSPKRPGVLSYEASADTRDTDNLHTLGGLDKDEIWLAEDHLLVLRGGAYGEDAREASPWPPIDAYEAPRRQVKLPQRPEVPPPFPVRLADGGPLVFLTPNGSVPAALLPAFAAGEGDGALPPPAHAFPPPAGAPGGHQGNVTAGGAPLGVPPLALLPGNASAGLPLPPFPFPFPPSLNATFPEGLPPNAAFLPPPGNQTDSYDEDDPSIYYPPPYSFSYRAESEGAVPAGPLVPGIVLPPPPDFFAPLEEQTSTTEEATTMTTPKHKPTAKRPYSTVYARKQKPKPTTTESVNAVEVTTAQRPIVVEDAPVRPPPRVVQIPRPAPVRPLYEPIPRPDKPLYTPRPKTTLKPVSAIYDHAQPVYDPPSSSAKPFEIYGLPQKTSNIEGNSIVTSTPVPLRAYYTDTQSNDYPKTELKPVYPVKQKEKSVASFYFFDEQPKSTPAPPAYFDGRHFYKTLPISQIDTRFNPQTESGFTPSVNVAYGAIDQVDNLVLWPHKQGPRTLTQEYFSIQKPKTQQVYIQQNGRPDFLQQIADIQHTIDYFTTMRPKYQRANYKNKPTGRPVYQYSYQSKPRQEHITFRAPKLDTEPFRPMVSYSKPYNSEDFNAISPSPSPVYHQQYLVENLQVTTETPTSSKYYPKANTKDQDYEDAPYDDKKRTPSRAQHVNSQAAYPSTTPSAVDHGYYTKQDERYVDEITKNYFQVFGKKIEHNGGAGVTPSLPPVRAPINNAINLQYDDESYKTNPPSLADDTLVNYRKPRPYDPDSEFVPIANPVAYQHISHLHPVYNAPQQPQLPAYTSEQLDLFRPPPNLASDIAVNFNRPLPVNPDAEFIEPINAAGEGRPGSFVSYRLPGDGAHVYFLTPQAARDRYGYRHRPAGR